MSINQPGPSQWCPGKTLVAVPKLTQLCQETLKHIGAQNHMFSSCNPSLKPEMEDYLNEHPHLLKTLGLVKEYPTQNNIVNRQPDLDYPDTSDVAEAPMLSLESSGDDTAKSSELQQKPPNICSTDDGDSDIQTSTPSTSPPPVPTSADPDKNSLNTSNNMDSNSIHSTGNTNDGEPAIKTSTPRMSPKPMPTQADPDKNSLNHNTPDSTSSNYVPEVDIKQDKDNVSDIPENFLVALTLMKKV